MSYQGPLGNFRTSHGFKVTCFKYELVYKRSRVSFFCFNRGNIFTPKPIEYKLQQTQRSYNQLQSKENTTRGKLKQSTDWTTANRLPRGQHNTQNQKTIRN